MQRRGGLRNASPRALRGWRGAAAPSRAAAGWRKNHDAYGGAVLAVLRAARQRREVQRSRAGIGVLVNVNGSNDGQDLFELLQ
ncbi:MAG: hypothetical protein M5U15_11605 [Kiritimatiellae bacterium]|nr:hypothetical protein [Kiritimatiellia bacterium]